MGRDLVITDPVRRAELSARVWRQVIVPRAGATTRCWLWTGATTRAGEPRLQLDSRRGTLARRVVFALYCTPPNFGVSGDRQVSTVCGNLRCLRPDHLRLRRMLDVLDAKWPGAAQAVAS
jgi:hypothetical protein